jgi:hypothetical protein
MRGGTFAGPGGPEIRKAGFEGVGVGLGGGGLIGTFEQ